MIRTSLRNGKKVIARLLLRREAIRTLADSELPAVAGGHETNCTADTYMASGCSLPPA